MYRNTEDELKKKGPCYWRTSIPCQPRSGSKGDRMCSDVFRSGSFSCRSRCSRVRGFIGAVLWGFHKRHKCSKIPQQLQQRAESILRYSSFFRPSISASLKRLTYFFFVFSFLPLLFASICLSLSSCFLLACVAAVVGTCLCFLSTSDVQMNCTLRSWSTRPLARSWTMPSMTWHLCRDACRSSSLSAVPLNVHHLWSNVPSAHLTVRNMIH